MFPKHKIKVPQGCKAFVNGRLEEKRPLRVRNYDQVYFVKFSPHPDSISIKKEANNEGIMFNVEVGIGIRLQQSDLVEVLSESGDSTWRAITEISAEDHFERQKLKGTIEACIKNHIQSSSFFDLGNQDMVKNSLHEKISGVCSENHLKGEVTSCSVSYEKPNSELLAQITAIAGIKEIIEDEMIRREYLDPNLGKIADYFLDRIKQSKFIEAEEERAKADAERAKIEAQKQIETARTDQKIHQANEEERLKKHETKLKKDDAERQKKLAELNSDVMEENAKLEHEYKKKRLIEKKELADLEIEVTKAKNQEEETIRERKRLDMNIELEKERTIAQIRAEEKVGMFTPLGELLEKLKDIPTADLKGVHTLISNAGPGGIDFREFAAGIVLGMLGRAAEGMESKTEKTKKKEK